MQLGGTAYCSKAYGFLGIFNIEKQHRLPRLRGNETVKGSGSYKYL